MANSPVEISEQTLVDSAVEKRVTPQDLLNTVSDVKYFYHETLTMAVITTKNGFFLVGESACADPKNYNKEIGEQLAYKDAFNKLWGILGYALKEEVYLKTVAFPATFENYKTYIGRKVVHAYPMTRSEYNKLRGWTLPENENGEDEGYIIEEANSIKNVTEFNGYISWSPKQLFEVTYS